MIGYVKQLYFSNEKKIRRFFEKKEYISDKKLEYEFLPSSQEITESPSSPLGRTTIWIIFIFLVFVISWSYIGKVDKVASAYGKIIPKGKLKIIKPMDGGIVTAIHVHEGQKVKKGQLLLELDNTIKKVDVELLEKRLKIAKLEKQFLILELENKPSKESLMLEVTDNKLKSHIVKFQDRLNSERIIEFNEKIKVAKLIIEQKKKELMVSLEKLVSLKDKLSLYTLEERVEQKSFENGFSSEIEWRNKKSKLDLNKQEVLMQSARIERIKKNIEEVEKNYEILKREQATFLLEKIVTKEKEMTSLKSELMKAKKIIEYQKLTSPVDGVVNGLSAYTLGGVINPSEAIITIVPKNTPLIAEILIKNSDVGFTKIGQEVELKLETFPFQDYGTIKGKIFFISPDSVEDENKTLVYKAQVSFDKNHLLVDGINKKITPGMTLTAEIKIGKRRIVDFFLSPFKKSVKEAIIIR